MGWEPATTGTAFIPIQYTSGGAAGETSPAIGASSFDFEAADELTGIWLYRIEWELLLADAGASTIDAWAVTAPAELILMDYPLPSGTGPQTVTGTGVYYVETAATLDLTLTVNFTGPDPITAIFIYYVTPVKMNL